MSKAIVFVGGGTGGHVFPTVQVAQAVVNLNPEVKPIFIGQISGPEQAILARLKIKRQGKTEKIKFLGIYAEKFRRYFDLRTALIPITLLVGVIQSFNYLRSTAPKAVFCKGGYVCVPVAIAAWILRIPLILHETDAAMGLANRVIAPFARKVAVTFPRPKIPNKYRKRAVFTGQPINPAFFKKSFKKKTEHPYIVVTGGSQGSLAINSLVAAILPQLLDRYHVIHLTGKEDFGRMSAQVSNNHYEPIAFCDQDTFRKLIGIADVVVSRAGGTIFELAALGKPAILIPLPTAANDHQRVNAEILAEKNAAIVLEQVGLKPEKLLDTIAKLVRDSKRRAELAHNIQEFAQPSAANRVARLILEEVKK